MSCWVMRWAAYGCRLTIFAVVRRKNLKAFAKRITTNAKPTIKTNGSVCGYLLLMQYSRT